MQGLVLAQCTDREIKVHRGQWHAKGGGRGAIGGIGPGASFTSCYPACVNIFLFLEMASFISICHFIHGTNYQNGGKQKQKGHLVGFYRNYH